MPKLKCDEAKDASTKQPLAEPILVGVSNLTARIGRPIPELKCQSDAHQDNCYQSQRR